MGRPPMGWAPAVFGRFLKPGGRGGRPKLALALPTMPLVREKARSSSYALSLLNLRRFKEAKSLMRKTLPVAQRVLGASSDLKIRILRSYAKALYADPAASLDDIREAVTTLEETARIARRVMGGAHPLAAKIELNLRKARAVLRAREASTGST